MKNGEKPPFNNNTALFSRANSFADYIKKNVTPLTAEQTGHLMQAFMVQLDAHSRDVVKVQIEPIKAMVDKMKKERRKKR